MRPSGNTILLAGGGSAFGALAQLWHDACSRAFRHAERDGQLSELVGMLTERSRETLAELP